MITLFLATVIGWYLVITCLFSLIRSEHVKAVAEEIMAQRGLFFLMAIITLILGLLLVASHNIWVMSWPVVITLFSWMVLISGLIRLLCPESANKIARSFLDNPTGMKVGCILFLLIGLFLLYHVYYHLF